MSRAFYSLTAGLMIAGLVACSPPKDEKKTKAPKNLTYTLGEKAKAATEGCQTKQSTGNLQDFCHRLADEHANNYCAQEERAKLFRARCPGTFKPFNVKPVAERVNTVTVRPASQSPELHPVAPAAPAPAADADLSSMLEIADMKSGEAVPLNIRPANDFRDTELGIACAATLTAAMERKENVILIPGSQLIQTAGPDAGESAKGTVLNCTGELSAEAARTPESQKRIERTELAHKQSRLVTTLENVALSLYCAENKLQAVTDAKVALALMPGSIVLIRTASDDVAPLRIFQCRN